jgi:hypothetical protein
VEILKPRKLQQIVQEDCDQMTSLLFGIPEKRISYCFREIIRNTFEHSGANECSVMGQKFEDTNNIEIATIDTGKGVLSALSNRHKVNSIESALKLAIKPGISGADTSGSDEFTNSGFGLYVLSEIGRRFGKFLIGTKGKMMLIRNDGNPQFYRAAISGTVVGLNIKTEEYLKNRNIVNQIIDEGESIAAAEGRRVKASASSRISI